MDTVTNDLPQILVNTSHPVLWHSFGQRHAKIDMEIIHLTERHNNDVL